MTSYWLILNALVVLLFGTPFDKRPAAHPSIRFVQSEIQSEISASGKDDRRIIRDSLNYCFFKDADRAIYNGNVRNSVYNIFIDGAVESAAVRDASGTAVSEILKRQTLKHGAVLAKSDQSLLVLLLKAGLMDEKNILCVSGEVLKRVNR